MDLLLGLDLDLSFERDGVVWTVAPGQDGIAEELFFKGAYQGETTAAVLAFVAEQRTEYEWIIDVGANIGTTSVPFARAGFSVVAIEPVPATLRLLRRNIRANGLQERVRIIEGAVATGMDEVLIAVSSSLGTSEVITASSDVPVFKGRYGHAEDIRVPAFGLDEALDSCGISADSIAIVWSDTQGSETPVIETGSALWAAGVPLFAEFWPKGLESKGGLTAFVDCASQHFRSFIDASDNGFRIAQALGSAGELREAARPVAELSNLAEEVGSDFTDVLLFPWTA
jgi:FkbM family methyltransferase